jgi:hypothetical protein
MLGDVVKKVAEGLNDYVDEEDGLGEPFLSSHNYRVRPFNVENFKPIKPADSQRKIAFVDGGNQPIVEAPNFTVQLNRAYCSVFAGSRRAPQASSLPQRIEFFSVTVAKFRKEQIFYDTSVFPVSDDFAGLVPRSSDLSFSSVDRRLMVGTARADIGRVATIARRFAEWEFAKHVILQEIEKGDFLVMDGTLRTAFPNESKYARAAYSEANSKGIVYTGLSKTSRMFTTTGLSLLGAVRKMAIDAKIGPVWYYYPIAESISPEHEAAIFIVKLNDQSPRIFRYEIQGEEAKALTDSEINEILAQLSINSSSLEFPGYPYGLVDADDNARVRHEEFNAYRVMLLSEISMLGASSKFMRHMQSVDAHDILETMREVSSS